MAVISIVGTSGVGKSFLVKQLAAWQCLPGFFEGEDGSWPNWLMRRVFAGDPAPRYRYFLNHYKASLRQAREVSRKAGIDCFVDGAALSPRVILRYEPLEQQRQWKREVDKLAPFEADCIILLVASPRFLKRTIEKRGRSAEANSKALARAIAIQDYFLEEAKARNRRSGQKDVLVIDRTLLDFSRVKDTAKVATRIMAFAKRRRNAL